MKKPVMLLVSILGCTLTLLLSQYTGVVIASALIGLIGGLTLKEYATLNYAASFAGMSSISVVSLVYSPILGLLVFIVWLLLEGRLEGVGGKLGTIALIAGVTFSLLTANINFVSSWNEVNITNIILWVITGIIGTTLTLVIREEINKNAVIASALVGLIGGILLSQQLALVLFSASFAGMSSKKRMKGYKEFIISGVWVGIIFTALYGLLPGIGGKLGFIGFLSVLITETLNK